MHQETNMEFTLILGHYLPDILLSALTSCGLKMKNWSTVVTAKWTWGSSIFSSIKAKLDIGLFVDFCVFTWFYQFLHDVDHKMVLFWSAEQLYDHIMQKLVKTGKSTEINKQSHIKFWLNWIKYGAVSYSLSCTYNYLGIDPLPWFHYNAYTLGHSAYDATLTKMHIKKNGTSLLF